MLPCGASSFLSLNRTVALSALIKQFVPWCGFCSFTSIQISCLTFHFSFFTVLLSLASKRRIIELRLKLFPCDKLMINAKLLDVVLHSFHSISIIFFSSLDPLVPRIFLYTLTSLLLFHWNQPRQWGVSYMPRGLSCFGTNLVLECMPLIHWISDILY